MRLPELTKPMKGVSFFIGNTLLHFNCAKTLLWSEQTEEGDKRTTNLIQIAKITRVETKDWKPVKLLALCAILGPIKITIGRVKYIG